MILTSQLRRVVLQAVICQLLICGVEFSKTVMFAWMFVEGVHLHNRVIVIVFVTKPNYTAYNIVAWG